MKHILLLILLLSFTGCVKDDYTFENQLKGNFYLTKTIGGIAGSTAEYAYGDISWIFSDGDLIVQRSGNGPFESRIQEGSYRYQVIRSDGGIYLKIDGEEVGYMEVGYNTLFINEVLHSNGGGILDGYKYYFRR